MNRRLSYDSLGQVINDAIKVDQINVQYAYSYDRLGNQSSLQSGDLATFPRVKTAIDMAGRLKKVGTESVAHRYLELVYYPTGKIAQQIYYNNASGTTMAQSLENLYNSRDWPTQLGCYPLNVSAYTTGNGDHFGMLFDYGTSLNGDIDVIYSKHSDLVYTQEDFLYDKLRRLSSWIVKDYPTVLEQASYQYDRAGNFRKLDPPGATGLEDYTLWTGTNQLRFVGAQTSPYVYNPNGNLVVGPKHIYTYDYRNLAAEIEWAEDEDFYSYLRFAYDADGRRVRKTHDYGYWGDCSAPGGGGE